MPSWLIKQEIDLDVPVDRRPISSSALMVEGDVQAHTWQVIVKKSGEDYSIADCQVTGDFILHDGQTVTVLGSAAGNVAQVVFAQECYAVKGPLKGMLRIAQGESLLTASEMYFHIQGGVTDIIIDPGEVVPNIDQVVAEYQNMLAADASAIAAASAGNMAARALAPYNAFDMCALLRPNPSSASYPNRVVHNGVTYEWDENGQYTVTGQATSQSICNLYSNMTALPFDMAVGRTYRVFYSATNVVLQIRFKINGVSAEQTAYAGTTDGAFTVPEGAVGARIRFTVTRTSVILDEVVKPVVLRDTLTNDELDLALNARIDTEAYLAHGVLTPAAGADSVDLNDVKAPGYYLLSTGNNYDNVPDDFPDAGGQLEVLNTAPNTKLQRLTFYGTNHVYIRQSASGEFTQAWKLINPDFPAYPGRKLQGKYVAFGDSLMYGAVWSPDVGGVLQQCDEALRIPTRIARAVGAYENFSNEAIGGIGYVKVQGGYNLVSQIKAYDFTDVELVTIHGGANDKLTRSGTLDAICAAIQEIIDWFRHNPNTAYSADLRKHMQKIQLVFMQPLPSGFDSTHDPWTSRGLGGWSMQDFDARVSELCRANHVGYVNWVNCAYCDTWAERNIGHNGDSVDDQKPNYTHPVVDTDYALLGDFIAGKIAAYGQNGASIPELPTTDGQYRLKVTVASGKAAYSWEAV